VFLLYTALEPTDLSVELSYLFSETGRNPKLMITATVIIIHALSAVVHHMQYSIAVYYKVYTCVSTYPCTVHNYLPLS